MMTHLVTPLSCKWGVVQAFPYQQMKAVALSKRVFFGRA